MDPLNELADRISAVERGSKIEETYIWDAIIEIRTAINRLEDKAHKDTYTDWKVKPGGPRHPDAE